MITHEFWYVLIMFLLGGAFGGICAWIWQDGKIEAWQAKYAALYELKERILKAYLDRTEWETHHLQGDLRVIDSLQSAFKDKT